MNKEAIKIHISNQPDIKFNGKLIFEHQGKIRQGIKNNARWWHQGKAEIYQTVGGNIVGVVHTNSKKDFTSRDDVSLGVVSKTKTKYLVSNNSGELLKFLFKNSISLHKKLLESLGHLLDEKANYASHQA